MNKQSTKPRRKQKELRRLSDFHPQRLNANTHTERGMARLNDSIRAGGYLSPMTAAADGELIDGSARLEKSVDVFGAEVEPIIVRSKGDRPIVHIREDIETADDPRAIRLAVEANRVAQLNLNYDPTILATLKQNDESGWMARLFTENELAKLIAASVKSETAIDAEPQIDRAEELRKKWDVSLGQLWALGKHRLICGDCNDKAVIKKVMGKDKAKAVVTDPPYAILGGGTSIAGRGIKESFDRQFFRAWFVSFLETIDPYMSPASAQWMTIDWRGATAIEEALVKTRWRLASVGVWNRGGLGMGYALRRTYENFVLLVSEEWKRIKTDEPDVWNHQWTPADRNGEHSAEKPVGLMARAIELCGGEIIVDPFAGSGTTILACENLNRHCRAIEISPGYAAVTLERWAQASGTNPELID